MMSNEAWQAIAAAIVAMSQIYASRADSMPIFAKMWDYLANLFGVLATILGRWAIQARLNYFEAVESYGN